MPYEIILIREGKNKGKYKVVNKDTGKVHASATSKENAEKQVHLMYGVESGKWHPTSGK